MNRILLHIVIILFSCLTHSQTLMGEVTPGAYRFLNDITYSSNTNRIYAVTRPSDSYSNSLISMDLDDYYNNIYQHITFDNEPTIMAMSDDNQYIYIGFQTSSLIYRFEISSQSFTEFELGNDPDGLPYYTFDIKVMPGNPETIAVLRTIIPYDKKYGGIGIYDNGVMREADTYTNQISEYRAQIYFKDENTLISYNFYNSAAKLNTYSINSTGIYSEQNYPNTPPSGLATNGETINYCIANNNKLFFNNGENVDLASSPTVGEVLDIDPVEKYLDPKVVFDKNNNKVCYIGYLNPQYIDGHMYNMAIKRYNLATNSVYDLIYIATPGSGLADKIIYCTDNTYAFIGDSKTRLYVVTNNSFLTTDEFKKEVEISVSPNPTKDILNIQYDKINIEYLEIYDLNGKLIISENTINGNSINVNNLEKGLYLIKLTDENKNIYTDKFVKN